MQPTRETRPIPGYPGYTIDQDGHVRRSVLAHGRTYQSLVPEQDGAVALTKAPGRAVTAVKVSTLMALAWPGEPPVERIPDGEAMDPEDLGGPEPAPIAPESLVDTEG